MGRSCARVCRLLSLKSLTCVVGCGLLKQMFNHNVQQHFKLQLANNGTSVLQALAKQLVGRDDAATAAALHSTACGELVSLLKRVTSCLLQ